MLLYFTFFLIPYCIPFGVRYDWSYMYKFSLPCWFSCFLSLFPNLVHVCYVSYSSQFIPLAFAAVPTSSFKNHFGLPCLFVSKSLSSFVLTFYFCFYLFLLFHQYVCHSEDLQYLVFFHCLYSRSLTCTRKSFTSAVKHTKSCVVFECNKAEKHKYTSSF